jgi:hypothetical protein
MSKPIEARCWKHPDGRTVSLYSSSPWGQTWEEAGFALVSRGWTVEHPDGTVGLGRPAFATLEEAQAWCDAHPHFPGMNQY